MKFKKKIITLLALISVAAGFGIAHSSVSSAQAKTNITTFPKKMRGTWYAYFNKKKIWKMTFTKDKKIITVQRVNIYATYTNNLRLFLNLVKRIKIGFIVLKPPKLKVIHGTA